jgi:hypothetical protein
MEPNSFFKSCKGLDAEFGSNSPREFTRIIRAQRASQRVETAMQEKIGYCRQKAAECAARAEEATDKDTRTLFLRFRDSWLSAAKRYESSAATARDESPQRRPSSFAPEPSAYDWRSRPNDARTDTTAERLGAA